MAGPRSNNDQFDSQMYLSPGQHDLLMAALNSNNPGGQNGFKSGQDFQSGSDDPKQAQSFPLDGINPVFFNAPQTGLQDLNAVNFDGLDDSPYVDFLDGDPNFDFDSTLNGDAMIGDLPGGHDDANDNESSEKRKSPEGDAEDEEGGGKRREGEDKTAKKPGRKPLTSEPTTKRKAQNRAAQRAFRERKEKHLKDLESKVAELEKTSDAANHENGLLRAQVTRLQTELREYRKRLSLNSSGLNRPQASNLSFMSGTNGGNTNFQFEFPRFGGLPGAHILNGSLGKPNSPSNLNSAARAGVVANGLLGRQNSGGRSLSPKSQTTGLGSPEKSATSPLDSASRPKPKNNGSISSPPLFGNAAASSFEMGASPDANGNRGRTDSSSGQSRVFQFNSGSNSSTDSPSASSVSQYGPNSSCGTSPEPSHNSPTTGKADSQLDSTQGYVCHGNSEANTAATNTTPNDNNGLDFLSAQNGGQFDPTLFGDYRDPQAAIVGDGDFTGGFFDDAFTNFNYGSPFNFGEGASPAVSSNKVNPAGDKEKAPEGADDEVVPADNMDALLNCHKIWDKLAQRSDFKDGTIDIDNLCTELRAKARCSESGVVVDNKDVEAALKRLPEANR